MGVYQKLSWGKKLDYQLYIGLEAMEHAIAEIYFEGEEDGYIAFKRLTAITPKQVFEYVAEFPCPSYLHLEEAIGNQPFQNSTEKTAFVIADCWKRSLYAVNGRLQGVNGIMAMCKDLVRKFVDSFKFGQRTRDKEGKLAQLKLDCRAIVQSLPIDTLEAIKRIAGEE